MAGIPDAQPKSGTRFSPSFIAPEKNSSKRLKVQFEKNNWKQLCLRAGYAIFASGIIVAFANLVCGFRLDIRTHIVAVIFLNDKFTVLKVVLMRLVICGFISYMYQHYLDDLEMKKNKQELLKMKVTEANLVAERG